VIFNGVGRADWKAEWEKTVAAAKKEAHLNFYVGRYGTEPLLNEFRKDYPEIKIISVNATGNQLGTRIISEIRAGKVIADLYSGGANTNYEILYKGKALDSIRSALILPEVVDESKWYGGQHRYTDPEQKFIFVYIATPSASSFYYNTALVNSKEFKSYWDLVNPKWKGKYVSQDPTSTGSAAECNFTITIRSWVPNLSSASSETCSRSLVGIEGRSLIGWRREDFRFVSAAGTRREQKPRGYRWTSWIVSIGKRASS